MNVKALNNIVENFQSLNSEDKEYTLELLQKQVNEEFRSKLLKTAKRAEKNYASGKSKSGSAQDLLSDLEND